VARATFYRKTRAGQGPVEMKTTTDSRANKVRQRVLLSAYQQNPERFPRGVPKVPELPQEVWINRPAQGISSEELLTKFDKQVSHFY
jgi:putative transposase